MGLAVEDSVQEVGHSQAMLRERHSAIRLTITIVTVLVLAGVFYQRAAYNLRRIDYQNSNFVFFWMAGRMVLSGGDPYDSAQWLAEHDANNVTWHPNRIFPYPLPLAFLLAPLGLLSLDSAYLVWQLISQIMIAVTISMLLGRQREPRYQRMFIPLVLILLFFGPVYLSLQIGALGAFTLVAVTAAIAALDDKRSLAAGILLSLTLLKPPQGLPILVLVVVWLLSRKDRKAIVGLGVGAVGMLLIGMLEDPLWLPKFTASSQVVMGRTLGVQSNALGLAYLACGGNVSCMWLCGGSAAIIILAAGSTYLWRHRKDLVPWEAFNLIIPTAFLSTIYLWSYDQILYIIPVVWIVLRLIDRTHSYIASFAFLAVLVLVSFVALVIQANTRSDLTSLLTTVLVLAGFAVMHALEPRTDTSIPTS